MRFLTRGEQGRRQDQFIGNRRARLLYSAQNEDGDHFARGSLMGLEAQRMKTEGVIVLVEVDVPGRTATRLVARLNPDFDG